MVLVAKKDRKLDDLLKQPSVSLSTIGHGSLTHVMAERFKRLQPEKIILVGYTGPREAVKDVIVGDLDLGFDFLGSVINDDKLEIIGITGDRTINGIKKIADLNKRYADFKQLDLGIFYLIPKNLNSDTANELRSILLNAQSKSTAFKDAVKNDFGTIDNYSPNIYQTRIEELQKLTMGMEKLD
jgi:tripartite-type tricarboxylate transporter receptor subunit TctC